MGKNDYFIEEDFNRFATIWLNYPEDRKSVEAPMFKMLGKLVKGVLNNYRFYRFEDYGVLESVAHEAILKSMEKFNPDAETKSGKKATWFNYLSKVAQQSMFFYTKKEEKYRTTTSLESLYEVGYNPSSIDNQYTSSENIDWIRDVLRMGIDNRYINKKTRDDLNTLIDHLVEFLSLHNSPTRRNLITYYHQVCPEIPVYKHRMLFELIREKKDLFVNPAS
jgi:hypothetical protein